MEGGHVLQNTSVLILTCAVFSPGGLPDSLVSINRLTLGKHKLY